MKICTAIKLRFEKKKFVRFLRRNRKRSTDMYFMKIQFLFLTKLNFFSTGTFSIINQTMFKSYF